MLYIPPFLLHAVTVIGDEPSLSANAWYEGAPTATIEALQNVRLPKDGTRVLGAEVVLALSRAWAQRGHGDLLVEVWKRLEPWHECVATWGGEPACPLEQEMGKVGVVVDRLLRLVEEVESGEGRHLLLTDYAEEVLWMQIALAGTQDPGPCDQAAFVYACFIRPP